MWKRIKGVAGRNKGITAMLAGVTGLIGFLILALALAGHPRRQQSNVDTPIQKAVTRKASAGFSSTLPAAREIKNLVRVYGSRIDTNQETVKQLRETIRGLQEKMSTIGEHQASALTRLKELDGVKRGMKTMEQRILSAIEQEPDIPVATQPAPSPSRIAIFDLSDNVTEEKEERGPRHLLHIPAGSFAEATLLTGVYAPTTGEPLPVLLRIDAYLVGPNRTRVPAREAFVVGKATGDPNSSRAVVQLQTLSMAKPKGQSIEATVNGFVADQDGIQGVRGDYVWRIREAAGFAALAGGLGGVADAFSQSQATQIINPLGGVQSTLDGSAGTFAAARGASGALKQIQNIVAKRIDDIIPAVYVVNGKKVTVVFLNGVDIPDYDAEEFENGTGTTPYTGLDGND